MRLADRALLLSTLAGLALAACTALLNFSPDGQPCNAQGGCLAGYGCVKGSCRALNCGACDAGTACDAATQACVPSCATKRCPVGLACGLDGGPAECFPSKETAALASLCNSDADCGAADGGRLCYRGQIPDPRTGALRTGVCVEPCTPGTACPGAEAGACRTLRAPLDAGTISLCLPPAYASACTHDADCAADGLICAVFDHPALGPASFCDTPLAGGEPEGAACLVSGSFCANGLCLPSSASAGQTPTCSTPCDEGTCPAGQHCTLAELDTSLPRHVPLCVTEDTVCHFCGASSPPCGPDAPHCTALGPTTRCLSACSATPGMAPACPAGYACTVVSGAPRCVPEPGGLCP